MIWKIISLSCLKTSGTKHRLAHIHIPQKRIPEGRRYSGAIMKRISSSETQMKPLAVQKLIQT